MRTPRSHFKPLAGAGAALLLGLGGCAATINQDGLEQRTATAIGRPAGSFAISERIDGNAGRIDYTVKTKEGATYKCYMYSATGFQKAMSFGQTPHSDALCTAVGGAPASPSACNALTKAAGKC